MYTAYKLISDYYGDQVAERSQVPLINHINEGLGILEYLLPGDRIVKQAYCLHPMLQSDEALEQNYEMICDQMYSEIVLLAMEYRNIANQSLSDIVDAQGLTRAIKLSPIKDVNCMLIADKVQNRADFDVYHKGAHPRSFELDLYFRSWLHALNISEEDYVKLAVIGKSSLNKDW